MDTVLNMSDSLITEMDVSIREVCPTDYEAFADFLQDNNCPEILKQFHPFQLTAETAYQIACIPHQDHFYVAVHGKRIVGLSMLRGWDVGFDIPSFGILIDISMHGSRLGRQLTEYTITEAKSIGCKCVRLSVYDDNVVAMQLYRSLGFRETERTSIIHNGELRVKVVMIKELEANQ